MRFLALTLLALLPPAPEPEPGAVVWISAQTLLEDVVRPLVGEHQVAFVMGDRAFVERAHAAFELEAELVFDAEAEDPRALSDEEQRALRTADAIFLCGGTYIDWFDALDAFTSPAALALVEAHERGATVVAQGGALGVISGGTRLHEQHYEERIERNPRKEGVEWHVAGGLGLGPAPFVDRTEGQAGRSLLLATSSYLREAILFSGDTTVIHESEKAGLQFRGPDHAWFVDFRGVRRARGGVSEARLQGLRWGRILEGQRGSRDTVPVGGPRDGDRSTDLGAAPTDTEFRDAIQALMGDPGARSMTLSWPERSLRLELDRAFILRGLEFSVSPR